MVEGFLGESLGELESVSTVFENPKVSRSDDRVTIVVSETVHVSNRHRKQDRSGAIKTGHFASEFKAQKDSVVTL